MTDNATSRYTTALKPYPLKGDLRDPAPGGRSRIAIIKKVPDTFKEVTS
jgi:hypothetical protein